MKKTISIICPVYNEEQTVPVFFERLQNALSEIAGSYEIQIIFVNNDSADRTLSIIKDLRAAHPNVNYLTLSRNFGHQSSLLCGLTHATGDAIVIVDADCEDPPELIPNFIRKWEEGFDIIYGRRGDRPEGRGLLFLRRAFYRITSAIADNDFVVDMAEFGLMTQRVRNEVLRMRTNFPFIRNEISYVGFKQFGIDYDREQRVGGKSSLNAVGLVRYALTGFLTASTFPLRLVAYLGAALLIANIAGTLVLLAEPSLGPPDILYLLDFSFVIFGAGTISIYLARVYKNGLRRPVYIVDWQRSGWDGDRPAGDDVP